MKKILLVTRPICPPWDEASKNFAYYLAKNLSGFEFYLLTNGNLPDLPENVHQKPIYTASGFGYFQKIRLIKHLRKLRNDFDIMHYLFTPTKQNTFLIKKFAQSKKTKTIQTIATLREDIFSDHEIKNFIFSDLIITYSNYAKAKLESLGFQNVKKIYPGIDLNLYYPAPKDEKLMENLGIKLEDFIVTYPGEYARLDATDDLMKMILSNSKEIKEKNIKIIFACRIKNNADAKKKEELRKILEKNGLLQNVLLPETFNTMEKVYNLSDVIIFPVRDMKGKFDIPLAIIEAMACGKPVILSNLPIFKEFANENNSLSIQAGDTEKLFSLIKDIRENKENYSTISENARKHIEENFNIKKVAEKYGEVYEKL